MSVESQEAAAQLSGRWVRGAMKQAGIGPTELARRTGISREHISHLSNDHRPVQLDALLEILWACGLEVAELRVKKKATVTPEFTSPCVVLKNT